MDADRLVEISDRIVQFDPHSLHRLPVIQEEVVEAFLSIGDHYGARIVANLPAQQGILDQHHVDQLLIRVHCEMQRLSEEFQHGRRVWELLLPLCQTFREHGIDPPYRLVDIGCGTGYVIRWLAAHGVQLDEKLEGATVELVGVDFNRALIDEAARLARSESLACEFVVADAFTLARGATVYFSTGVLHHFRGHAALSQFFRQHSRSHAQAFFHFDFQPTVLARPGAWLFHYVRMREPLAYHDGIVSARRAHSADTLLAAAPQEHFVCGMYSRWFGNLPIPRVFQALLGIRPEMQVTLRKKLGRRAARWEVHA